MEFLGSLLDILLHLDVHLQLMVAEYGIWIYVILFSIIFAETGFVVTPFLPGDSLLFVAGAIAALGDMHIGALLGLLSLAAVLGNMANYQIGRYLGPKVFQWENSRLLNRGALLKTQAFYERHGGKTLFISRFLPLLRTFAPFVAGIGAMHYGRFSLFNVSGAVTWVFSLCFAGYWFGNLTWVRQNLSLLIIGIIAVSFLPALVAWILQRRRACKAT
ncbi:MAG: DedA family protein [Zoogloeaceae bacterium]|nr:DedA family protein [Zoogloeaceae bacterium]